MNVKGVSRDLQITTLQKKLAQDFDCQISVIMLDGFPS